MHVGAGDNHSACVTSKGVVYTWGSDLYGQLGIGEGKSASSCTDADAHICDVVHVFALMGVCVTAALLH